MNARALLLIACLSAAACVNDLVPSGPPDPLSPVVAADQEVHPRGEAAAATPAEGTQVKSPDKPKKKLRSLSELVRSRPALDQSNTVSAASALSPERRSPAMAPRSLRAQGEDGGPAGVRSASVLAATRTAAAPSKDVRPRSLSIGTAVHKSPLTNDEIMAVAEGSMGQVRGCYERELKAHPTLSGQMVVSWRIRGDGSVTGARATEDALGSDKLQACVLSVVQSWGFRASGSSIRVAFPFFLKPSSH